MSSSIENPPKAVMLQFHNGGWEHRAFWGEDLITLGSPGTPGHVSMGPLPKTGEWVRLEVAAARVGLKSGVVVNGWAFTQFDGTCYWDRAGTTDSRRSLKSPWQKLAAAYRDTGNSQAIDRLIEQRPQTAGPIGDLFTQGENQDWQRAVELYGKAIAPETTDAELLAECARAYEELKDYSAAAADWVCAAGENPEQVNLTEFASRLVQAGQQPLATAQAPRARQILEATLRADPGDDPAIDSLAGVLLDLSEPKEPVWTVLKPAESMTERGAPLTIQSDHSILVEQRDKVTLPAAGQSPGAIRIETWPDDSPPRRGRPPSRSIALFRRVCRPKGCSAGMCGLTCPATTNRFRDWQATAPPRSSTWRSSRFFVAMTTSRCGKRPGSPATRDHSGKPNGPSMGSPLGQIRTRLL